MKKVFIVNSEQGTRVITANVLANDLKKTLDKPVKRRDVEFFAEEAVNDNSGRALDANEYVDMLNNYGRTLENYSALTPYTFYLWMRNEH